MTFTTIKAIAIPDGGVTAVSSGGVTLWKKSFGEYTFVGSIDVPAGTKLDTGLTCKSGDYFYVDFGMIVSTAYGTIFYAGTSNNLRVYVDGTNLQLKIGWYNQNVATTSAGTRYTAAFEGQIAYLNGVQKASMAGVPAFTPDTNLMLGGLNNRWRLYGFKHGATADSLDLDCVPAVRNSDSVAGLYDNISKAFKPYGTATT